MKNIYFIVIALWAVISISCGGSAVDSAMSQVEKALERVEKNKATMTPADWKALETELDEPLKALAAALENNEVGALKRLDLIMLTGRVTAVLMEAGMNTAVKEMENAGILMDDLQQDTEQIKEVSDAFEVSDTAVNSSHENE